MKILCIHAHFDDYEFVASGTFELLRRRLGARLHARVIVCTDGQAGHHFRSREETGRIRVEEQRRSAEIGGYEFEQLRLPDGRVPREACLQVSTGFLAALWKAIRDFEPDYLICPPIAANPLAGIHVDHESVAQAVRKVAYMINVPHAFTVEYPIEAGTEVACRVPVILNAHDSYMAGENAYDLAIDVEEVFSNIAEMSYCHQSQIAEWLPWVGRHRMSPPGSLEEWKTMLRDRFARRNAEMGIASDRVYEFFTVTAWGEIPNYDKLVADFPNVVDGNPRLEQLRERLRRWG